jgi:hypothetical protein
LRSGKTKEFGETVPDVLAKGYYAVSNPNKPYKWTTTNTFPNDRERNRQAEIHKLTEAVHGDKDYGKAMFYFTNDEEKKLRTKKNAFNFSAVKPTGRAGIYNTYAY